MEYKIKIRVSEKEVEHTFFADSESEKQLCAETICFCYGVFNHDIIEIVKK